MANKKGPQKGPILLSVAQGQERSWGNLWHLRAILGSKLAIQALRVISRANLAINTVNPAVAPLHRQRHPGQVQLTSASGVVAKEAAPAAILARALADGIRVRALNLREAGCIVKLKGHCSAGS